MGKSSLWWGIPAKSVLVGLGMALGFYLQATNPEIYAAICSR